MNGSRLDGAVRQVERAIDRFVQHRDYIRPIAAGEPFHMVVDDLQPNFLEHCVSTSVMARN